MAYTPNLNGGRLNADIAGNTAGLSSAAAISTGTVVFAGGTNITLSQSTGIGGATISFNAGGGSGGVQSLSMYGVGNTTQSSAATLDARSISVNGLGALSVGYSNSSMLLSAPSLSTLSGAGIVSVSTAGSNIAISAPAYSAGMSSGVGNTAGTGGFATNQLVLAGGNNITLSQATGAGGNTLSIIGAAGGTGGGDGVALYDGTNSITSGTANIQASGALTASINAQTLNLSVPPVSTLSGAGAVSVSTDGNTIIISGPSPASPSNATLSRWEHPTVNFSPIAQISQGTLSVQHEYVPFNVSGSAAKIGGSLGLATSAAAQVGSVSISLWMGIYTMSGETLSLATSGSANNSFTFQAASSATTGYGTITGMRELTVPMSVNMTPGEYWVGAVLSTATSGGLNGTFTLWGNTLMYTSSSPVLAPFGATTISAYGFLPGQGIYKTSTSGMPTSIPLSSINNYSNTNVRAANFYHAFYNTSYS